MFDLFKKIWNWIVSIPQDKLLHDYAGALICLFVFALLYRFCPAWLCFTLADIVAVAVLALKELYDAGHREVQTPELADFLWGVFGVVKINLALLIMFV